MCVLSAAELGYPETGNRLTLDRAVNKREYLVKIWDNLCILHKFKLNKTVQMRVTRYGFNEK